MDKREEILKNIYYDINNTGSFGGVNRLFGAVRRADPSIDITFVKDWLQGQETYTNFRSRKKNFSRLPVLVDRLDEQWQADLMDMSYWAKDNNNNRYLLVVIDVLSRFAWVEPVRDKSSSTITGSFRKLFDNGRKPEKLQTDQGKEFKNKRFQDFCSSVGVHYFTTTDNSVKCALAERFIRTLRAKIYRYMYHNKSNSYIDDLQKIVDNYNNSFHRTIKTSPNLVTKDNQQEIVQTIQKSIKSRPKKKRTIKVDDHVKIPLNPMTGEKGASQQWTDEVFKVSRVKETPGHTVYKLKDLMDESITSIFYPEEVQKVKYDPNSEYRVAKVLDRVYDRRKRLYKHLIRWEGWPKKFDTWIWDESKTSKDG